jgi:predicted dehydrogenase
VSGSTGTLAWTDAPNAVRIGRNATDWSGVSFENDRNDMFMAAADEFLAVLGGRSEPSCGPADGVRVMRVLDAARRSNSSGNVVILGDDDHR